MRRTTQMSGTMMSSMSSPSKFTDQQRRILELFKERAAKGEPPPTHRELCREFGWTSTGTARDHIRALVRKGALLAGGHRARGAHLKQDAGTGRFLPLVGRIQAGRPLLSDENVDGEVFVSNEFTPAGRAFVLRVHGDSMEGAGILEGDLVVVRQSSAAIPGKIVAVTVDGESTLKILHRDGAVWRLISANPKYLPIEITSPAVIHGQVTAVLRKLINTPDPGYRAARSAVGSRS